jgi:hypothetical protein
MTPQKVFEEATAEVKRYDDESHALGDIDHLNATKKELNDQIRENKAQLAVFKVYTQPLC